MQGQPEGDGGTDRAGGCWSQTGETGGVGAEALALHPTSGGEVYAGTYFEGLFATADGGENWSNPLAASTGAIAIDPDNGSTVYAGTWHSGAYKSTDGDENWSPINTGLAANDVYAILVDPEASSTVYAGTEMGIFKSTNGGASWQGASSGFTGRNVYALALTDGALLAGTDLGVFKSSNAAATWAPTNEGLRASQVFDLGTAPGSTYAATDRGVFCSGDEGDTWTACGSGLPAGAVNAVVVGQTDPLVAIAGTSQGVYATASGSGWWSAINEGLSGWALHVGALALDETTTPWTIYAGTSDGVWSRALPVLPAHASLVYLPAVLRSYEEEPETPPTGICGTITHNGAAAVAIELKLRHWDGDSWSTAAIASTDAEGAYSFTGVPGLGSGETYYVRYGANTTDDRYLYMWYGPDITLYTAGQSVPGGDFDIANIEMLLPEPGATVSLPVTFTWEPRGVTGDTYRWGLLDPTGDDSWWTDDLGAEQSFELTSLPTAADYGHEYGWHVYVFNGPDSYGSSFYYRSVTFIP